MTDRVDVSVDVAIVGAGVIGCSVAFQLSRMERTDVLLIEKEPLPGAGSTSKANGGIRAQFTTEVNIAMSLASMEILDALEEEIGDPPLYRKAGYLFLTDDAAKLAAMTEAAAYQLELSVDVEVLDGAGVRAKAPYAAGPIVGGTFGPRDGFIDPGGLANFFLREATRAGVKTRYNAEVTAIEQEGGGFRLTTASGHQPSGSRRGRTCRRLPQKAHLLPERSLGITIASSNSLAVAAMRMSIALLNSLSAMSVRSKKCSIRTPVFACSSSLKLAC